ncbi:BamA/TamA family outer membrane protein [Mangrovibacterium diazotrophicum]|uniref:Surface antigen-like protein n=1 Tax=Mangrovibacterium diazotrophicum TaxID=1261403 RepID=A0A419W3Z5_9BACT|nr:BamA/TamA family outer membrane protein [Mangrovibacterium diazotrophicum]RKD90170.1 surface antigen-like protein [Mangrovibacterium diazotrophicum]
MKQILSLTLLLLLSISVVAQEVVDDEKQIVKEKKERLDHSGYNFKFIPLPYVNYNRSIGMITGVVPMIQLNPLRNDTLSPLSTIGALGLYSANESWGAGAFGMFYLKEDTWRISTGVGTGTLNFQFFLNLLNWWIPYDTRANFFVFIINRKIVEHLYGGLSYTYVDFQTNFADTPVDLEAALQSVGAQLILDSRNNVYNPFSGSNSKIQFTTFPEWMGNDFVSRNIDLQYNQYFSVRSFNDVLAVRFYGGVGIGDLSFNQQFVIGGTDVRGYTQGKYRGNNQLALQAEYRWNPFNKVGFVGFGGIASILDSVNDGDNGKILPGAGLGFRYVLLEKTGIRVGLDLAKGQDDWGVYFRIGEAF